MPEHRTDQPTATPDPPAPAVPTDLVAEVQRATGLGERATLVQVSSAFCAPCRAARTVLARVAEAPGVRHVEVDVAGHEALAAQLDVRSTPVVLVLDADGRVRERLDGVPRLAWLREAVSRVAPA